MSAVPIHTLEPGTRFVGASDGHPTSMRIQAIIDTIPADVFLGVMATDIEPKSWNTCLVCRLISPERPYRGEYPPARAAAVYGLPADDMADLFWLAASDLTVAEVEEAIADRLNRLVSA